MCWIPSYQVKAICVYIPTLCELSWSFLYPSYHALLPIHAAAEVHPGQCWQFYSGLTYLSSTTTAHSFFQMPYRTALKEIGLCYGAYPLRPHLRATSVTTALTSQHLRDHMITPSSFLSLQFVLNERLETLMS